MRALFLLVVAQVFPSLAKNPCPPPDDPTHPSSPPQTDDGRIHFVRNVTISDGRILNIYIPPGANGRLPAVIHWHGFNNHRPVLDYHADVTRILDQAEENNFVVIMPLGTESQFAFEPVLGQLLTPLVVQQCEAAGERSATVGTILKTTRALIGRWGWNSIGGGLNGGRHLGGLIAGNLVDDKAFTKDILHYIRLFMSDRVDPSRVYTAGFSNGAFQAYGVGCEFPEGIAAVGANAGTMSYSFLEKCRSGPAVPVQSFHSRSDTTIPYDRLQDYDYGDDSAYSGLAHAFEMIRDGTESLPEEIKHIINSLHGNITKLTNRVMMDLFGWANQEEVDQMWRDRNGCTDEEPVITKSSSTTTCKKWNCPNAPVESCVVENLGHCWIGGRSGGYDDCQPRAGDIDATAHMFAFWEELHQKDSAKVVV